MYCLSIVLHFLMRNKHGLYIGDGINLAVQHTPGRSLLLVALLLIEIETRKFLPAHSIFAELFTWNYLPSSIRSSLIQLSFQKHLKTPLLITPHSQPEPLLTHLLLSDLSDYSIS